MGDEVRSADVPKAIASPIHTVVLLVLLFGMAGLGFVAQHHAVAQANSGSTSQLAAHSMAMRFYITSMIVDWALFYYCFVGVHWRGGGLATLSGGRWKSGKDVLVDLAIAAPFFLLWEGVAYGVHFVLEWLRPESATASVAGLLPHTALEVTMWILVCLTAGFCEEIAFRGYLQKQFHSFTGSVALAVLLQGLVFGITHGYQGWKNVVVITALGILYGMLAAWRRNLRANMMSHAFSDMWEGWLKFVLR